MANLIPGSVRCTLCNEMIPAPKTIEIGTWPFTCPRCGKEFTLTNRAVNGGDINGQIRPAL
jgi:predicted RNA-binding Zn-ribbon protein involved in translation (DUF1610 family)